MYLLGGQRRARDVAPAGITDHGGEIANQKNNLVAQILQLTHFIEYNGMPQMNVGRGGVEPQLDAQRGARSPAAGKLAGKLGLDQQFVATTLGDTQIRFNFGCYRGIWRNHKSEERRVG